MRLAFFGCKDQGRQILRMLCSSGFSPTVIVCLSEIPDHEIDQFRDIAVKCDANFILDRDLERNLHFLNCMDFGLVCRFRILPRHIFNIPKWGCFNIHSSLTVTHKRYNARGEVKHYLIIQSIDFMNCLLLRLNISLMSTLTIGES